MNNCKHFATCPYRAQNDDCLPECPCYANADVVEVVRCKDCWKRAYEEIERRYWCAECGYKCKDENWYCADGERRKDD